MAEDTCPNCGKELPSELGQHATAPLSGLANCPYCGADVQVPKEGATGFGESASGAGRGKPSTPEFEAPGTSGRHSGGDEEDESFAGHETIEGLKRELEEKQE